MIKKYLYYFIKKTSEKSHRNYYTKYYSKEIEEYQKCKDKKKVSLIKKEMSILHKYWKVYPFQYFRYRFYHKNCNLTIEEMKDYLPDYFAFYLFYPRSFKERNILCEDKKLFSAICKGFNINQPALLCSISKGIITNEDGQIITIAEAVQLLNSKDYEKIFLKPTYGVGGREIIVLIKKEGAYYNASDNSKLSEDSIRTILSQEYIVQAGLNQHEAVSKIYPHSINTFRIITHYKDNQATVLFSILRLGQHGKHVDNASSGGMYIKVDKESGVLDEYAVSFSGEKYIYHPDTNFKFSHYQIPYWEEIIKFSQHLASCFKEIEYLGWDITYTENGPAVIEANNGPGVSLLQDCYGGIRKHLNISDPNKYWYSENYALKDL